MKSQTMNLPEKMNFVLQMSSQKNHRWRLVQKCPDIGNSACDKCNKDCEYREENTHKYRILPYIRLTSPIYFNNTSRVQDPMQKKVKILQKACLRDAKKQHDIKVLLISKGKISDYMSIFSKQYLT